MRCAAASLRASAQSQLLTPPRWCFSLRNHTDWLEALGAPTDLSTMVLLQDGKVYTHSDGPLIAAALLDAPWCWLSILYAVPRPLRNIGYRIVAANRYLVFGKTDGQCRAPSKDFESRFWDYVEPEGAAPETPF